jgi:hypothetical protein
MRSFTAFLLAGALTTAALTTAALTTAGPAQAAYSDPLTATSSQSLVWHATPSAALSALDAALPNVSANVVVHDTDHSMTACAPVIKDGLPIAPAASRALCWDYDRDTSTAWVPQSITTSGDADDDGLWGTDKILLSGWHGSKTLGTGRYDEARIMFINYNNTSDASYRMVYLAVPSSTGSTFTAAKAHMGGMAWYGDKIFVTAVGDTSTAILVFSTKHLLQMTSSAAAIGKQPTGEYAAYGYKYAAMQIGYYSYAGGTCSMSSDTGVPCFSSLSLDRSSSPDSLVTTEYFSDQTLHGRLYRYPMGTDYLLAVNSSQSVASTQAYRSGVGNMQGVLSRNGHWYLAHSSASTNGQLWDVTTGSGTSAQCGDTSHACWAMHPESLTLDVSSMLVWSVTEWTTAECAASSQNCGRTLFAVPFSSIP